MKELSKTQQIILDAVLIHKGGATTEQILKKVGLPPITIHSSLKILLKEKALTMQEDGGVKTYQIAEAIPTVPLAKGKEKPAEKLVAPVEDKGQEQAKKSSDTKRDFTKYKFGGADSLSKGRLVLAIVTEYVKNNRNTTLNKLKEVFPEIKPYGLIVELSEGKKISGDRPRFFLKPEEQISLKGTKIVVSNQVTGTYLESFLMAAKKVGLKAQIA